MYPNNFAVYLRREIMSITKMDFGLTKEGRQAYLYEISNEGGMKIAVSDYGAALVSVFVPDKNGNFADVVLGYDDVSGYENGDLFLGATVGRNANRIARARFDINGRTFLLEENDGKNNLHSGYDFYNKRIWQAETSSGNAVSFLLKSKDGDQGFPGNADISVTYTLTDENEIRLDYEASADKDTVFNFTNHSYFNLDGVRGEEGSSISTVLDHEAVICAEHFTPSDAESIPTGQIFPVEGTPMDFRSAKKIGAEIGADYDQLIMGKGYDHNWAINGEGFRKAAELSSEKSGIRLCVFTDLPGMQFYTANFVDNEKGKGGMIYPYRSGACLETQYFPDSVNRENFKSPVFKAGQVCKTTTVFKFEVI